LTTIAPQFAGQMADGHAIARLGARGLEVLKCCGETMRLRDQLSVEPGSNVRVAKEFLGFGRTD